MTAQTQKGPAAKAPTTKQTSGTPAGTQAKGPRAQTLQAVKEAGTLEKQKAVVKPKEAHAAAATHGESNSANIFDHPITTMTEMIMGPAGDQTVVDQAFIEALVATPEGRQRVASALGSISQTGFAADLRTATRPPVGAVLQAMVTALKKENVTKGSI